MSIQRILAVIDPTTENQRALYRAVSIARNVDATVYAYLCISSSLQSSDSDLLESVEKKRYQLWLADLIEHIDMDTKDVNIEVVIDYDPIWADKLVRSAKSLKCDLIVKCSHRSKNRSRRMKNSDKHLLRTTPCPVVLVRKEYVRDGLRTVLLALNLGAEDEAHIRLNEAIIETGKTLAAQSNTVEVHAVNAYANTLNFIHPPDLAKKAGIPRNRAHVVEGDPDEAIAEIAAKIDASITVIGTVARKGIMGMTIGNTVERILDNVDSDLLIQDYAHLE